MRKEMITRSVDGTKVTLKVVSKTTDVVSTKEIMLSKDYTEDEKKALKECAKLLADTDEVIIRIESLEKIHKLFGLDTAKFMELATELDPATRQPLKTEAETEVEA